LRPLDNERAKEFRSFLLRRFEDTISLVLGEWVEKALFECMEKNTGLKRDELIIQIDVLNGFLKRILGRSALVLEGMIAKQIYRELGLDTPPKDFEAAIEHAKQAYMSSAPNLLVSR